MHVIRRLAIVVGLFSIAAQPLRGQASELRSGVFRVPSETAIAPDTVAPPAVDLMILKSVGWSLVFGGTGGMVGLRIDDLYCDSVHGDEEDTVVPPCLVYTAAATPVGWFVGSAAGAAFGAVGVARRRGCTSPHAHLRALGGALLGVAPSAAVVAFEREIEGAARSRIILGAPILAGLGATLALHGCRA